MGENLAEHMLQTPLTPRALEVLRLIAKALRNEENLFSAGIGFVEQWH